jgi:hypothetical protein
MLGGGVESEVDVGIGTLVIGADTATGFTWKNKVSMMS